MENIIAIAIDSLSLVEFVFLKWTTSDEVLEDVEQILKKGTKWRHK